MTNNATDITSIIHAANRLAERHEQIFTLAIGAIDKLRRIETDPDTCAAIESALSDLTNITAELGRKITQ